MTTLRICQALLLSLIVITFASCGVPVPGNNNAPLSALSPLDIGDVSMPDATVGVAYSRIITATGGVGGNVWTIASGALPAGLSLATNAQGNAVIGGTPAAATIASFQLGVRDLVGNSAAKDATLTVIDTPTPGALVYAGALAFDIAENQAFTLPLSVSGGVAPYGWSLSASPAWASINAATGELTGVAPAAGAINTYDVTFVVGDTSPMQQTLTQTIQFNVLLSVPSAISITSAGSFDVTEGTAFTIQLTATGGLPPYSWALDSAPGWVSGLNASSGKLTGTAPAHGSSNHHTVTFTVADSAVPAPVVLPVRSVGINVMMAAPTVSVPVITTTGLPGAYEGHAYGVSPAVQLQATGGTPPYVRWSVGGALPAGITLDAATGSLSGTPAARTKGTYALFLEVEDSVGTKSNFGHMVTLDVRSITTLRITTASLPDAFVGTPYSYSLAATGGPSPYTWSYVSGLPAGTGLSVSADGVVSGTPAVADAGAQTFRVEVSDILGRTIHADMVLHVFSGAPTLTIIADLPVAGAGGDVYGGWIRASGGMAPYDYAITDRGTLPLEFTLGSLGYLGGVKVSGNGTYTFKVRVADAEGAYGLSDVSLDVVPCPAGSNVYPLNDVLPKAYEGVPYTFMLTAAAPPAVVSASNPYGQTEIVWERVASVGTMPAGVSVFQDAYSAQGWQAEMFGTPAWGSAGTYSLQLKVRNFFAGGPKVTFDCTLVVDKAAFHIANRGGRLVEGSAGQPYGDRIVAAGGQGSGVQWSVRSGSGALPTGLILDSSTGEINGTISAGAAPGDYTFIADAEDLGSGAKAAFKGLIQVNAAPAPGSALMVAGGGGFGQGAQEGVPALNEYVGDVWGIAFDMSGNLYISETRYSTRVRRLDRRTQLMTTVAGTREYGNSGNNVPGGAINARFDLPTGIAVDRGGTVYAGGLTSGAVRKIDASGTISPVQTFGSYSGIVGLSAIAINPAGTHVYVVCILNHNVVEIELATGNWQDLAGSWGTPGTSDNCPAYAAAFNYPVGLGFDPAGNLYVSELGQSYPISDSRVRKIAIDPAIGRVSPDSTVTTLAGTVNTGPNSDLAIDGSNKLYYVSNGGTAVLDLASPSAPPTYIAGVGGASFSDKRGLAVDPISGEIYMSSMGSGVYKIVR